MRKDEEGNEVPATLGEYRKLCMAIGGPECSAVVWLDQQISESRTGEDELVIVPDSQMRVVLMPRLVTPNVGQDSAGRVITLGSRVKFRDKIYTIKSFLPGQGRRGVNAIEFVEGKAHVDELPDEISVDVVPD